jgi:hypothetical protein
MKLKDFRKCFVSYSIEEPNLCSDFINRLKDRLEKGLPKQFLEKQQGLFNSFKKQAEQVTQLEIKKFDSLINNQMQMRKAYKRACQELPTQRKNREKLRNQTLQDLESLEKGCIDGIVQWWSTHITPAHAESIIRSRRYGKQEAKDHLADNLVNDARDEAGRLVQEAAGSLEPRIKALFSKYEQDMVTLAQEFTRDKFGRTKVQFDFQGALAGALSSGAALGILALWAESLGNLGWYIIVAKGVSLLSALGIGTGGTASALAFISAWGGPIVWGAMVAVFAGLAVWNIFGKSWQRRLSGKVCEMLREKKVKENILNQCKTMFKDTAAGLVTTCRKLEDDVECMMEEMRKGLNIKNIQELEASKASWQRYRGFYDDLPWASLKL